MARPPSDRVNLTDIAERLGLSVSTVSRSLRGLSGINPATEARIAAVAQELGYGTDAKPQKRPRTGTEELRHVLVLAQSNASQINQGYLAGMSDAAMALNIAISTHLVPLDRCAQLTEERYLPPSLRGGLVQGVVLFHSWPVEVVKSLSKRRPVVSLIHEYPGTSVDVVGLDDRRGIAELVGHLHAAGHRRIGFFGFCPEVSWSRARFAAYVETLMVYGLPYDPRLVIQIDLASAISPDPFPTGAAGANVRQLVGEQVDAWVCSSSRAASSLHAELTAHGLRVPADVALTSYHGIKPAPTDTALPPYTTTAVSDEELGAAALHRLLSRLDNPRESRRTLLLPAPLVIGASTRALPASPV